MKSFSPITLGEMDEVQLMNRTDTKFVMERGFFNKILPELANDYRVLNINGNLISNYKTLYFDEPDYAFYLAHHNGKGNRYKVRIRNYVESNLFFFEIKNKFKGRTDKRRIKVPDFEMELGQTTTAFAQEVMGEKRELEAKLWNSFGRITLVNKVEKERLTLDLNLCFSWKEQDLVFNEIVIAELKQENVNRNSLFYRIMKTNGVRPNSMSKYCVGALQLFPNLKGNNFKDKIRMIDKLRTYELGGD
ncbi:MAG: polyphosphate polymerase domain-containing protein [Crocinitomicaceae bacterium]|nr:polyphosphate polymerase domain-containing protein [Crocinitomicaceae bacterium]